jgi:hypothetical protein
MVQKPSQPLGGKWFAGVRTLGLKLPEVEESTSYGTAALKVRGKLLVRLKEDGQTLVLRTTFAERERLLAAVPDVFYLTDHYLSAPWILVRLPQIEPVFLAELLAEAWRIVAPPQLAKSAAIGKPSA